MGAWGLGVFENDGAMDWSVAFLESPSEQAIHDAFDEVLDVEGYIEADQGSYVSAAAELVAANPQIATQALMIRARDAVDRVAREEESELAELWAESDEVDDWIEDLDGLKDRLS